MIASESSMSRVSNVLMTAGTALMAVTRSPTCGFFLSLNPPANSPVLVCAAIGEFVSTAVNKPA